MKQPYIRFLLFIMYLLPLAASAQFRDDDAGLHSIWTTTAPCEDSIDLYTKLSNYSFFNELQSADIKITMNGKVLATQKWSGLIPLYGSDTLYLGKFALEKKLNSIVAWTENPNNYPDKGPENDTAKLSINGLFLNGAYTVGGSSPDFATISDAVKTLSAALVCSDVTFNIRPGTYKEYMDINGITSFDHTVTFQSEDHNSASVKIEYNSAIPPTNTRNALVIIGNAGNIRFRDLTFTQTNTSGNSIMYIQSENFTMEGCVLNGNDKTGVLFDCYIKSPGTIRNCTFNGGQTGISGETLSISNCFFRDQLIDGIKATVTEVSSNTITSTVGYNYYQGMDVSFYYSGKRVVCKNKIIANAGHGIRYRGDTTKVYNNYIYINSTTSTGYGIYLEFGKFSEVYHNTVLLKGKSPDQLACFVLEDQYNNNLTLRNNILINEAGGYALKLDYRSTSTPLVSNTNFFYSNAKNKFSLGGTDYPTLRAYQLSGGLDSESVFRIPYFINSSTYITQDIDLFIGPKIPFITDDIDGNPRTQSRNCIGAYESKFYKNDAKISRLVLNDSLLCSTDHPLEITLKNAGSDILKSATIHWSDNGGTLKTYNWSGNLTTIDSAKIILETTNFHPTINHALTAYLSDVNGIPDDFRMNDTLRQTLKARLKGAFLIGKTGADFTTIKQAVTILGANGMCGPVDFKIMDGEYTEDMEIPAVYGSSAINTITFESASGDSSRVTVVSDNNTIFNVKPSNVIFKRIGFRSTVKLHLPMLSFNSNCTGILITNCKFQLDAYGTDCINAGGAIAEVKVINCFFDSNNPDKNDAFFVSGSAQVVFSGNTVNNLSFAVVLKGADAAILSGNTLNSSSIYVEGAINQLEISNNRISYTKDYALELSNLPVNPAAKRVIKNNFINGLVYLFNCSAVQMVHNTVSYSATKPGPLCDFWGSTNLDFRNNILHATGNLYIFRSFVQSATNNTCDHNDYYTPNDTVFMLHNFSTSERFVYTSLGELQAVTGQDVHSFTFKPQFISASDLHLNNDFNINNKGIAIPGVTNDIDGDVRGTIPDIGADEFNGVPPDVDASLPGFDQQFSSCDSGMTEVKVRLLNNGKTTLTSAAINWQVNGVAQPTYNWTGSLATDESKSITLGTFPAAFSLTNKATAYCSLPNGKKDENTLNDTTTYIVLPPSLKGTYTIGKTAGNFKNLKDACNYLNKYGICGPVVMKIESGVYTDQSIKLKDIKGSSPVNTITFQSASNRMNEVVISQSSDTTLRLIGTSYVRFKSLSLTSIQLPTYFLLTSIKNATDVRFDSIQFSGPDLRSSGTSNLSFQQCIIKSKIILTGGNYKVPGKGLEIKNCLITGSYGMRTEYFDSVLITNNHLVCTSTPPGSATDEAMMIFSCTRATITKNYFDGEYKSGLSLSGLTGTATQPCLIANNSIAGSASTRVLIQLLGICSYIDILYNSCLSITPSSPVIFGDLSKNIRLQNNVLVNTGDGSAIEMLDGSGFPDTDYNIIFTKTNNDIEYKSKNYTLADYKTLSGKETHSTAADPAYTSNKDLHYTNAGLNGLAIPFASVPDDIQSKLRNASTPNPGAFEFAATPVLDSIHKDLGAKVTLDTLRIGSNYPTITITHNPLVNPDPNYIYTGSIDTVDLYYQIEGGPLVNEQWTGKLAAGQSVSYTFVTPLTISKGKLYNFRAGSKIHSPAVTDINTLNDTIYKRMKVRMSGTYTIGGSNPDFVQGDTAALHLSLCHSSAPVTFLFRPGHYSLLNLTGLDTALITSETGKKEDVELDIKNITGSNKTFKHLSFLCIPSGSYNATPVTAKRLVIDSCNIKSAPGTSATNGLCVLANAADISISNTIFSGLLTALQYQADPNISYWYGTHDISYNRFDQVNTVLSVNTNINRINPDSYIQFHHNKFSNYETGIYLTGKNSLSLKVYNNDITDAKTVGIAVKNLATTLSVYFYNNFISGGAYTKTSFSSPVSGNGEYGWRSTVQFENAAYQAFSHNSIYGTLTVSGTNSINLINNCVFGDTLVTFIDQTVSTFSDFNNFYTHGEFLAILNLPTGTVPIRSLDGLKAHTAYNTYSLSVHPYYTSFTDLHSNAVALKGKGTSATTAIDFDDQPRNLKTPDIGADEIDLIEDEVWAGDANADSRADNTDLLSIGLYYGETGTARTVQGNSWLAYASAPWTKLQYNNVNMKHADCNGDGEINDNDTVAIIQNFNRTHDSNHRPAAPEEVSAYNDLFFIMPHPKNVYKAGDTIDVEIWLGRKNKPAVAVYGISFDVSVVASCMQKGTFNMNLQSNWIGTFPNAYCFSKLDETQGLAYAAIVRKDHVPATDSGKLGRFYYIYKGNALSNGMALNFENVLAIDEKGNKLNLNIHNNNANNYVDIYTGIPTIDAQHAMFEVFPNPLHDHTTLRYQLSKAAAVKLELYNSIGELIQVLLDQQQGPGIHQLDIDIPSAGIAPGVYLLKMTTGERCLLKKIVVER